MKETFVIKRLIVGQLATNCYIIYDNGNRKGIIIDPGDDAVYIESKINDLLVNPVAILVTHGHFDHLLAVEELRLAYKAPFYINSKDIFLLKKYKYKYRDKSQLIPQFDYDLTPKTKFKSIMFKLSVIDSPGHTPGGLCLYLSESNILFCGDLIFKNGLTGRVDFSYCNENEHNLSIKRILALPDKTKVYPGHGEPFTLKEFKNSYTLSN